MQTNQPYGTGSTGGIDPSELSMQNGAFPQFNFGSQQNMSSSFNLGNSGIGDDELLDLELTDTSRNQNQFQNQHGFGGHDAAQDNGNLQSFFPDHPQAGSIPGNNHTQMQHVYSNTPDGTPIQSPFVHGFNYAQFGQMQPPQLSQHTSPRMRPSSGNVRAGSYENSYMSARPRPSVGNARKASDSRSPMTPKTPALSGLHLGTPESGSFPSQPIHTNNSSQHRHQKSLSNQWDSTPGSLHSYIDSPISSPGQPVNHAQISEILNLANMHPYRPRSTPTTILFQLTRPKKPSAAADELSHLVPQHRLEDEKVRKHLVNNSPLAPTLAATGISPPQATSLLAGGAGRRATGSGVGNITVGIPIEEKDKGPNKGDILNGAVGWTRDLMWALHVKMQQESELADLITQLGGTFPFEPTEEELRMRTELLDAIETNDPSSFSYTRGPGSGLRVPKHTNVAGDPLTGNNGQGRSGLISMGGTLSPQSLSPGVQEGGSGANSGRGEPQFWSHSGRETSASRRKTSTAWT
ncbi:MAG: hypothetical protein FRX48_09841 [Lasallia pustulata]|uniref:Uncharacterized protein n=1 Tax=Lasallia pustulata TaxID=136370 RepID=A0A5M8PBK8_9LECA|nr:MAG: hypothetical protein FRX48_09841 [Lasallia pustulata]